MQEKNPVQSAQRIFTVFEILLKGGSMGLTDIAAAAGLNKSTAHRLLSSLIAMDYVEQDEATGKYEPTLKILSMSSNLTHNMDVITIAHPVLKALSASCRETVHLVQREGVFAVYIDKVESDANSVRMASKVGLRLPMYCTAVGKAMLAAMTPSEVRDVWNKSTIEALTPQTITRLDRLQEELETVRRLGYALDNEENEPGVRCMAASVFDFRGRPRFAFSISAPISRMTDERIAQYAPTVAELRRAMSLRLGYHIPEGGRS